MYILDIYIIFTNGMHYKYKTEINNKKYLNKLLDIYFII